MSLRRYFSSSLPYSQQYINIKCFCSNYPCGHRSKPYKLPSFPSPPLLMQLICYEMRITEGDWEGNSDCLCESALYFCQTHLFELIFSRCSVWWAREHWLGAHLMGHRDLRAALLRIGCVTPLPLCSPGINWPATYCGPQRAGVTFIMYSPQGKSSGLEDQGSGLKQEV